MTPHWADESVTVFHGDCIEVMAELDDNSVDAIVTDPPYGLEFMGKEWDKFGGGKTSAPGIGDRETPWVSNRGWNDMRCRTCGHLSHGGSPCRCDKPDFARADNRWPAFQAWCEAWATECLRVLKPGGHMLAFGGTRTWHRLACAVEDAGFEIRDNIAYLGTSLVWVYGAGFPKSHNVNKALAGRICECEAVPYRYDKVSREGVSDLREDMAADDALPVDAEQDLLTEVRGTIDESEQDGHPVADEVAAPDLPGMRDHVSPVADEATGTTTASLLTPVQGETRRRPDGDDRGEGPHRVDHSGSSGILEEDEWPEQSGVEGRGNPQTTEGELHGGSVRPVPAGVSSDGTQGRLHHGAPSSDGSVDRSPVVEGRSGKPQGPQPVEQRPGEPRALADERRPQAWRGWPVCSRCGKPEVPSGLGTALKPAHEPIVVARKPLVGTVAANVLAHGTGALNVDGCRIGLSDGETPESVYNGQTGPIGGNGAYGGTTKTVAATGHSGGRWPANVILDESQAAALDEQSGTLTSGKPGSSIRGARSESSVCYADMAAGSPLTGFGDSGGASRFFKVIQEDSCNHDHANTAANHSSQPSAPADSARNDAATSAHHDTPSPTRSPSTSETPSESRPNGASGTPATSSTEPESSPAPPHAKPSQMVSRVRYAASLKPTDTTTTTPSPSTSDGSAEPVTSSITPASVPGVPLDVLAERFRYIAKADTNQRPRTDNTAHPTVKPLDLMRWLVRLITPPGGIVLDPFAGSGTTAEACIIEGFHCVTIEREADYLPLIVQRLSKPIEPVMF